MKKLRMMGMRNTYIIALAAAGFIGFTVNSTCAEDKPAKEQPAAAAAANADSTEVTLKDLKLTLPASWKSVPSTSSMRLATYEIPAADGDKEPAELTVFNFNGGGGDLSSNLTRWIGQFSADGRSVELWKGKSGENNYYVADIVGTYQKPKGPPVLRQTTPAPGYRMLGVVIELEGKGVYYLKLAGPDATVKAQSDALRASFGGKKDGEQEYQL
jgi:gluconolactonase